jgi:hypothetical protein
MNIVISHTLLELVVEGGNSEYPCQMPIQSYCLLPLFSLSHHMRLIPSFHDGGTPVCKNAKHSAFLISK